MGLKVCLCGLVRGCVGTHCLVGGLGGLLFWWRVVGRLVGCGASN